VRIGNAATTWQERHEPGLRPVPDLVEPVDEVAAFHSQRAALAT